MNGEPNNNQKNNKRRWIAGAAVLIAIAMAVTCGFLISPPKWSEDGARAEINQLLDTTIPENATNVHWSETRAIEWQAYARFDAPPEDIETWLAGGVACFDTVTRNMNEGIIGIQYPPMWWERDSAEVLASDYCLDDYVNHPHLFLDIDQTNDDLWIVYLYADDT